jgi:hypothetical protein
MESPESILEVAGNAQEEPGLSLGSSGHRVGFWVTGLRGSAGKTHEPAGNRLLVRRKSTGTAGNRTGLHHRRIGLRVSLPGLAGSSSWVPSIDDPTPAIEGSASIPPETASLVLSLSPATSLFLGLSASLDISLFLDLVSLISQSHSLVSVSLLSRSLSVLG